MRPQEQNIIYDVPVFFEREKNYCGYVDYMVCDGLFPE